MRKLVLLSTLIAISLGTSGCALLAVGGAAVAVAGAGVGAAATVGGAAISATGAVAGAGVRALTAPGENKKKPREATDGRTGSSE
jgi:hypothetical protein